MTESLSNRSQTQKQTVKLGRSHRRQGSREHGRDLLNAIEILRDDPYSANPSCPVPRAWASGRECAIALTRDEARRVAHNAIVNSVKKRRGR
jgi:hypothetical protein